MPCASTSSSVPRGIGFASAPQPATKSAVVARVPPFQRGLGDARVIAVILNEPVLQRRVVARVPEDDRKRDAVGAVHPQHGHRAIDRAERSESHAPVRGKAGFVARVREPRRTESRDGVSDDGGELVFELPCVGADVGPLLRRHVVRDRQLLIDDRAAVRVARIEEQVCAANSDDGGERAMRLGP